MKLYEHKYMDFIQQDDRIDFIWIYNMIGVTRKVFVAPFMDNKIVGKEPGTDYDNAFMKSYDDAVDWLNA